MAVESSMWVELKRGCKTKQQPTGEKKRRRDFFLQKTKFTAPVKRKRREVLELLGEMGNASAREKLRR